MANTLFTNSQYTPLHFSGFLGQRGLQQLLVVGPVLDRERRFGEQCDRFLSVAVVGHSVRADPYPGLFGRGLAGVFEEEELLDVEDPNLLELVHGQVSDEPLNFLVSGDLPKASCC